MKNETRQDITGIIAVFLAFILGCSSFGAPLSAEASEQSAPVYYSSSTVSLYDVDAEESNILGDAAGNIVGAGVTIIAGSQMGDAARVVTTIAANSLLNPSQEQRAAEVEYYLNIISGSGVVGQVTETRIWSSFANFLGTFASVVAPLTAPLCTFGKTLMGDLGKSVTRLDEIKWNYYDRMVGYGEVDPYDAYYWHTVEYTKNAFGDYTQDKEWKAIQALEQLRAGIRSGRYDADTFALLSREYSSMDPLNLFVGVTDADKMEYIKVAGGTPGAMARAGSAWENFNGKRSNGTLTATDCVTFAGEMTQSALTLAGEWHIIDGAGLAGAVVATGEYAYTDITYYTDPNKYNLYEDQNIK